MHCAWNTVVFKKWQPPLTCFAHFTKCILALGEEGKALSLDNPLPYFWKLCIFSVYTRIKHNMDITK